MPFEDNETDASADMRFASVSDGEGSLARARSDSVSSQDSVVTTVGDAGFNESVFMVMSAKKQEGQVGLLFTAQRPETVLGGSKQGDHVISHRLVLELCANTVSGKPLEDAPSLLQAAFKEVVPEMEQQANYPPPIGKLPSYDAEVIADLKEKGKETSVQQYKRGVRDERTDSIIDYATHLLTCYNAMPDVAHAKTGTKSKSEGPDTSATIVALRSISACLSLGDNPSTAEKDAFFNKAVVANGDLVKGTRMVLGGDIETVRKIYAQCDNRAEKFHADFQKRVKDPREVGRLLENLFDFPAGGGRELGQLSQMADRCVRMAVKTFPELKKLNQQELKEGLVEQVKAKQKWKVRGIKRKAVSPLPAPAQPAGSSGAAASSGPLDERRLSARATETFAPTRRRAGGKS